jgi:hypothetical protein
MRNVCSSYFFFIQCVMLFWSWINPRFNAVSNINIHIIRNVSASFYKDNEV